MVAVAMAMAMVMVLRSECCVRLQSSGLFATVKEARKRGERGRSFAVSWLKSFLHLGRRHMGVSKNRGTPKSSML